VAVAHGELGTQQNPDTDQLNMEIWWLKSWYLKPVGSWLSGSSGRASALYMLSPEFKHQDH
jgi:hypothetical protein